MITGDADQQNTGTVDARVVHREFLTLGALVVAALVLFFVTRRMAEAAHDVHANAARQWYAEGTRQFDTGASVSAIAAFRKAAVNDPRDRTYALALARALAAAGRSDDAETVLRYIREHASEDGEVNLQLARIAASRHDVTASARLYRNAVYGVWPTDNREGVSRVRIELARMLIANGQPTAAASELMIVSLGLNDPAESVEVAGLMTQAQEYQRALDMFDRVLRAEPRNAEALAGAGDAAYRLALYARATRYFRQAMNVGPLPGSAAPEALTSEFVISHDPLAPRLLPEERLRRLLADLDLVVARMDACPAAADTRPDIARFRSTLRIEAVRRDPQLIEHGLELIDHVERSAQLSCGAPDPMHAGLLLMAAAHGVEGH